MVCRGLGRGIWALARRDDVRGMALPRGPREPFGPAEYHPGLHASDCRRSVLGNLWRRPRRRRVRPFTQGAVREGRGSIVACATRALAFPLRRRHADRHRRRDKSRPVARANSGVRGIRFPTSDRARGRTLCDLLHVPLVLCARGRGLQPPNHSSLDGQFHGRGRGAQRHPSSVGHRPVRPPVLHRVQFWLGESRTRGRYLCPVGPP